MKKILILTMLFVAVIPVIALGSENCTTDWDWVDGIAMNRELAIKLATQCEGTTEVDLSDYVESRAEGGNTAYTQVDERTEQPTQTTVHVVKEVIREKDVIVNNNVTVNTQEPILEAQVTETTEHNYDIEQNIMDNVEVKPKRRFLARVKSWVSAVFT